MDPKLQQLSPPPHGPFPILMPLNNLNHQHSSQVSMVTAPLAAAAPLHQQMGSANGDDIVTLFPRRKAGQTRPGGGRGPVVLTLELLEQFYGMPLHVAAKRLGICQTAIKKVCRRLGIKKWPYKEMRAPTDAAKGADCSEDSGSEDGQQTEEEKSGKKLKAEGGGGGGGSADAEALAAVNALLSLHAEA